MNLTANEIQQLKNEGYTDAQIKEALAQPEDGYTEGYQQAHSGFQALPSDNLIKWQLELNDILERAEHILRQDIIVMEKGEATWKKNPRQVECILNDYGVQEIMRVLSMYINRNTILSDYEPDEIKEKVLDFGMEINNLIFMKYEEFGLDNQEKRKNYGILVREIVDIVHSAYNRAKWGKERQSLREARQVQQVEQVAPPNVNIQTGEIRKERSIMNPKSWFGEKTA